LGCRAARFARDRSWRRRLFSLARNYSAISINYQVNCGASMRKFLPPSMMKFMVWALAPGCDPLTAMRLLPLPSCSHYQHQLSHADRLYGEKR
jgi:hypothetical protein